MSKLRHLLPSTSALFVFEAAARHLNFKKAASELNVTQPSVSQSVKALEQHCGARLFVRENRGVQLTEAGRDLYESVRFGFQRIEDSLRSLRPSGPRYVTIAASTSVAAHWLVPQLHLLQQEHPEQKIAVVTTDRDIEPDAEIDMTIWIRDKAFRRPGSWYLCDEVVFPICSPTYLATRGPFRSAADLTSQRLLHSVDRYRKRIGWAEWLTARGVAAPQAEPDLVFNDYQLVLQAAIAGEGMALGWNLSAGLLVQNRMLVRPLPDEVRTGNAFFLVGSSTHARSEVSDALVGWFKSITEAQRA